MTQRDPKLMRVNVDQLRRVLAKRLARPLVEDCVRELEAQPEGDVHDVPVTDEDRMRAQQSLAAMRRRKSA